MDTNINFTNDLNGESDCRISFNLPRKIYNLTAGRAVADGAIVVESESCTYETMLNIDRARLLNEASLLLLPNTYKESKLYSHKPLNGNGDFTATRATTATRVNSSGLVDLVPYNLLQYSEQFNQNIWTVNAIAIDINNTTAPDGTLTAEKIRVVSGQPVGSSHIQQIVNKAAGILQFSCSSYLKAAELNSGRLFVRDNISAANNANVQFNLNTGVISLAATANGTFSSASATITNVGNGWYRCTLSFTSSSDTALQFRIGTADTTITTGNGTDGLFVWGAQVVEGTSARDYLRTETRLNIPRVDYSLGGCPNILLEPQRTNLALQSSSFDSATWTKAASSVTANSTTSPSGVVDADTFTGDGTNAQHQIHQSTNITSGLTYTTSIYAKKNTNNFIQIYNINSFFGANVWANFDLNNGVVGSVGSSTTASIQNVGNGWYRCTITGTAISSGTSSSSFFHLVTSATSLRGEANTLNTSLFLWGAQLEAGAYATSYIPTTTASVTRNLDVVQATNVPSLIGQTEGTLYWEGTLTLGQADDVFYINRNVTNSLFLYKTIANGIIFRIHYGGTTFAIASANTYTGIVRIAAAYKSGNSVLFINGVQVGSSATAFTFTGALSDVVLNNTAFFFGNQTKSVKTASLFTSRLTNQQMSMLTSGIYPTAAAAYASLGLVSESPSCLTSTTTF